MDCFKTGNFIKELRTEKGMTQKELAEKINVSVPAVSKWENGRGFPDISVLEPLSEALCISISELIKGEKNPSKTDDNTVAKELIELSKNEKKYERTRQIFIISALAATLFLVVAFVTYDAFCGYKNNIEYFVPVPSIIGLAMFLFGGNAIVFSILGLFLGGKTDIKKSMQISLISEACCAASIWFGSVYTSYKVNINDISAVLDTANALELESRILFFATILINVFAYHKIAKE